jgi:hypothetical protein
VSTTAHALEALHEAMAAHPAEHSRLDPVAEATAAWLVDVQHADGCWWDKWHASPYYATACCVDALLPRTAAPARRAVRRAVAWTVATQHADGSWGRWGGTVEETAYGVQTLAGAGGTGLDVAAAISAGAAYLRRQPDGGPHRGLWHAKDLYAPLRVVRAARLAALAAADRRLLTAGAGPTAPAAADRRGLTAGAAPTAPAGAAAAPRLPAPRAALSRRAPVDAD